jgi:selenide,water dikinase
LCGLPLVESPNLIIGLEKPDDAGVYKITEDIAIVQTVDFFTPIIDDPFVFGQVAAANSLSDIYAMGGKPITAMNIVGFPIKKFEKGILREVLRGGLTKMAEADVVLVGGHSIDDPELKYGLSVTGIIHPQKILTKQGAQPNDGIILTKPLGTGIIATALKGKAASTSAIDRMAASMTTLNRKASVIIQEIGVHACTDITGFGLIGHSYEVANASQKGIYLQLSSIPVIEDALEYAAMGLVPGGARANRQFYLPHVEYQVHISPEMQDILYDPQTSGGLLVFVAQEKVNKLLDNFKKEAVPAYLIGEVTDQSSAKIIIGN